MFVDKAQIHIRGGAGGRGCVSFYRAKYIPNGGPDGGNGGRGGRVIFAASSDMSTLMDFRYKKAYAAEDGKDGQKRDRTGANGKDLIITVPVGALIKHAQTGKVIADMSVNGAKRTIIEGAKGGRGNAAFVTPVMQAPNYAEKGSPARELDIILELKLIADVGIIGFPNAGKSMLLSQATNAKPKIADYKFTTLSPNLGVVRGLFERDFVMADIPGIIEGASEGAGLGFDFLRHIERTKMFIHVVDASGFDGDPIKAALTLNEELKKYNPDLLKRPQIIAANKTDITEAREGAKQLLKHFEPLGIEVMPISAATGVGIDALIKKTAAALASIPDTELTYDMYVEVGEQNKAFTVSKQGGGDYAVTGVAIDKMFGMTNLKAEKGFAFFQRFMRDKGIINELKELGAKDGDTITVCGQAFLYIE